MPNQQQRQRAKQTARRRAAEAARRRSERRKKAGAVVGLLVALAVIAGVVLTTGDDGTDVSTDPSTPTTAADDGRESAAGKPCVAVSEPLPEGAPEVPIQVGPPPDSLVIEDLVVGDGAEVAAGATITAHYVGVSCSTGAVFDASYTGGQPATFPLTNVIPGWQEGIPGMKVGGRRLLGIPASQAYGEQGRPGIAPDEALWFVVDVVEVA